MWLKWLPWRYVLRNMAQKNGFLDPLTLFSRLERFAQPAEVAAPVELLRSGAVMHARGLINSQAIQHNLDWVWPYWVECQFNPHDKAFIPRAFSITHINLTHRNWTAAGLPGMAKYPIVDPRGLVTPFFDGWSVDAWIIPEKGEELLPSKLLSAEQRLSIEENLRVITKSHLGRMELISEVWVEEEEGKPTCHIHIKGYSRSKARLVVALRPYNPEGISFIHDIALLKNNQGWLVNKKQEARLDKAPDHYAMSLYRDGDVHVNLSALNEKTKIHCEVGMATAAAIFELEPSKRMEISVTIPLGGDHEMAPGSNFTLQSWEKSLENTARLRVPDKHFQFLYDTAVRTLILHSPGEVFPGPYTYRRFWFRDAAFILNAMLCIGLKERAKRAIDKFPSRQTPLGYFLSQEGEWDSNGEALWTMQRYCELTNSKPDKEWRAPIHAAGLWISRKRLAEKPDSRRHPHFRGFLNALKQRFCKDSARAHEIPKTGMSPNSLHAGLLPSGFSAEHLGPNDYYYWDDFWGVAGLEAAGFLEELVGKDDSARKFYAEAKKFLACIERSLTQVENRLGGILAMPASPHRRLDAGAIGSLVGGYPLQILEAQDPRLKDSVDFLIQQCLVNGGFFQDMTHSGINPYLTLHMAQVLLRAGDERYFELMKTVADLASPTGQWPEAIHPQTGGGCMGDGQHVWAAAEWVLMLRNCFIQEEKNKLVLCAGIPPEWLNAKEDMSFGPTLTKFGAVSVFIKFREQKAQVSWQGQWFGQEPEIEVRV